MISVIGVTLVAAIITLGVVMLVRRFCGRSTPVVTPGPAGEQSEAARKAVEILARVRAMYASLEAYQDTGLMVERVSSTELLHHTNGKFSTVYRKPHSLAFYFEPLVEERKQEWYWIVMDGDRFESRTSGGPAGHPSMPAALAGLAKESWGATVCTPPLLLQMEQLNMLRDLQSPEYVGTEQIYGKTCYNIRGKLGTRNVVLSVDRKTFLLKNVDFDDRKFYVLITPKRSTTIPGDAFATPPAGVWL